MRKNIKSKIDESIIQFLIEADNNTIQEILKEEEAKYDTYIAKRDKYAKKINFLIVAQANKAKDERLLLLADRFKKAIEENIEKPISILKGMISNEPSFGFYRNLDKLSKEDIIEIIKDKNFVNLLEELEKKDGN